MKPLKLIRTKFLNRRVEICIYDKNGDYLIRVYTKRLIDFKKMEISAQEKNYRIPERADEAVQKHGSIDKALTFLKAELAGWEDAWGMYSSECLGHGITCNRLLVNWLERKKCHCI